MNIKKPTPPIQTAYAENNTNNNNFYECLTGVVDAVGDMAEYSTTPIQVGTWIDGTPVWRWAFKLKCKDMSSDDYTALRNRAYQTLDLPVTSNANVLILNSTCTLCVSVDEPSASNDRVLHLEKREDGGDTVIYNVFGFDEGLGDVSILPSAYAELQDEGFIGYAEFVTAASNISND